MTGTERQTRRQTTEQERAQAAHEAVQRAAERLGTKGPDYKSVVEKAPAMILGNGLGQALAFLGAKGDEEKLLYRQLSEWVPRRVGLGGDEGFLEQLIAADVSAYRLAQREALAYVQWLKRFAQAKWPKKEEGGS